MEALLRYPKAGCRIEILGIEEHDGLRSLVVDMVNGKPPYEGEGGWERIRIAVDRNYICWSWVLQWWYYNREEKKWEFACRHATVEDWIEYEPGMWFPARWRSVGLLPEEPGRAPPRCVEFELIGRLVSVERLEGGLSRKLLELRFPPGTVVHELDAAGEIVRTYEVPEVVEERPQIRLLPLGLTALATVLLLVLWYALRRNRRLQHD